MYVTLCTSCTVLNAPGHTHATGQFIKLFAFCPMFNCGSHRRCSRRGKTPEVGSNVRQPRVISLAARRSRQTEGGQTRLSFVLLDCYAYCQLYTLRVSL